MADEILIYHEKQESNFCGKHCINNLLQYPLFDEVELSKIALNLDEKENKIMDDSHLNNKSQNVSDDGNFSVEVLREALRRTGLSLNYLVPQSNICYERETGFILNSSKHWFSARKIGGTFYNLDSLSKAPVRISEFYLNAFMESQIGSGHSVFAVRGKYPFLGYDSIPRKSLWTASQLEHSTSKKIEKTYNCKLSKKKSETSLKPIFVFGKEKLAKLNKIEENGEKAKVAFIDDLGQKAIFAFNKDEKIKTLFEAVNSLIKPEENETKIGRFKLVSAMPRKLFGQLDHESRLSDFELFRNGNAALRIQF